jgi:hypothetical protein
MGRIKYQEAAGLSASRQLILDQGKDLNEFFNLPEIGLKKEEI